jgi:hypothetical protein
MINAILRRFELMSLSNSELPSGYKKLEFIYNPNQAYIDTGVDGGHFNKTYCKFMMVQIVPDWSFIWGCRFKDINARSLAIQKGTSKFWMHQSNVDKVSNIDAAVDIMYEADYNNGIYTINGQTETFAPTDVFTNTYNCVLFGINDTNSISDYSWRRFARMKCYSFKIWDNGKLIRDFIPARQLSDDKVGMYDKVEGKFYSSAHEGYEFQGSDETLTTEYIEEETTSEDELIDGFTVLPDGTTYHKEDSEKETTE